MARLRELDQPCAGDGLGELAPSLHGHERVLGPVQHGHRQAGQLAQAGAGVVAGGRGQLGVHGGRRGGVGDSHGEVLAHALRLLAPRARRVQRGRHEPERAAGTEHGAQRRSREQPPGRRAGTPAGRRAREHERAHPVAMIERQVLGDHAAHRGADHVRRVHPGGVEHGDRVGGHSRHRQGPGDAIGVPGAAVVDQQQPPAVGQVRLQPPPHPPRTSQTHDHQHGLAVGRPGAAPVQPRPVALGERHR